MSTMNLTYVQVVILSVSIVDLIAQMLTTTLTNSQNWFILSLLSVERIKLDWRLFMRRFVLSSTFSGRLISNLSYNRKEKRYYVQLTDNLNEARVWKTKALAEAQAQRLFEWNRRIPFEVKEVR